MSHGATEKPVRWIAERVKSPPFSDAARAEVGRLLGMLQQGLYVGMPASRPLTSVGPRCHELRIRDDRIQWRLVYRLDRNSVLVARVFAKKSKAQQQQEFSLAKVRLKNHDLNRPNEELP